ncbi:hypothetical protein B0H14DRAFT_3164768 [Mycena olivaceomarginata]|nr:hypothetical protein B0H14DRAFT_3164768 [Mycena olivaceomarginata]
MTYNTAANTAANVLSTLATPPHHSSDHEELTAVLATVNDLVFCSVQLTRLAQQLQSTPPKLVAHQSVPELIARIHEHEVADHTWVRVVAKTSAQVEAEHAAAPQGSRTWWVVFIGREPGLYTTIEEVDRQIKGYPNQQYRRKHDKKEALMAYAQRWQDGGVEKSLGLDPGFAPSIRLFRSVSPPLAKRPMKTGNHTRLMVGHPIVTRTWRQGLAQVRGFWGRS